MYIREGKVRTKTESALLADARRDSYVCPDWLGRLIVMIRNGIFEKSAVLIYFITPIRQNWDH